MMQKTRTEVEDWLKEQLSIRSGLIADELDLDRGFMEYGIDSAESVVLVGDLEQWLQIELPATLLFEHVNVSELSRWLVERCRAESQRT
jgi:acyl carrier protein